MSTIKKVPTYSQSHFAPVILRAFQLLISYLSFNILTASILISFAFIIVFVVNLSGDGDFSRFANIFNFFGIPDTFEADENDIIKAYLWITTPLYVISSILKPLTKKLFRNVQKFNKLKLRIILITVLLVAALVSTFFPQAPEGANTIRIILVIFWLISLPSLAFYSFLNKLSNFDIKEISSPK
ncbi:hypothetical protein JXA63_00885 [Candidatus Woesebacteria bacterium]|nr:hypothetical protein [Candidatus Woesebacteria bacterium]